MSTLSHLRPIHTLTLDLTLMEAPEAMLLLMPTMAEEREEFSAHTEDPREAVEVAKVTRVTTTSLAFPAPALTTFLIQNLTMENLRPRPRTNIPLTTELATSMDSSTLTEVSQRTPPLRRDTTDQSS